MDLTVIASEFCFTEAPCADGGNLWFSDLIFGGVFRLDPAGAIDRFMPERQLVGGIAINSDGRILCSGTDGLALLSPVSGSWDIVLDSVRGVRLPPINDIFPDGNGGLYLGVTDGVIINDRVPEATSTLYRLRPDGTVDLLQDGIALANGMGVSPDGTRLYQNETYVGTFSYAIRPDGSLTDKVLFSGIKDCDGLAMDAEGGVWIACFESGAIVRVMPDGREERRVALPVRNVTSLCFGGPDWRDLYITTAGQRGVETMASASPSPHEAVIYRTRSDVPGLPVPVAKFAAATNAPQAARPAFEE